MITKKRRSAFRKSVKRFFDGKHDQAKARDACEKVRSGFSMGSTISPELSGRSAPQSNPDNPRSRKLFCRLPALVASGTREAAAQQETGTVV
jgi:hypothetical protein